jgi:predicted nucleotidyltransferase
MEKQQLFDTIKAFLIDKKIKKAAIFGSYARNEENDKSDIDVLIDATGFTFFDILRIEDELGTILSKKIDFVEFKAVKESLKKYIFPDMIELI